MKLNKLIEAAVDDIEEFLTYVDTNQSISALHAEYVSWAKNNGRTALSLPGFRYHYKRLTDGDALEAEYSTGPTITAQVKTEEMDDFEKDVLNNSVIYAFELAAEAFKQLLTWNPGFKNIFFYGSGGVGKSFLAKQAIKQFADPKQVEVFKGTISGFTGLLQILWENRRNKIIIFDDNDSVLSKAEALNILKAAMDSDEPRIISYTRMKKGLGKKKEAILQIDDSRLDEQIVEGTVKGIRFSEKITKDQVAFYKKILEAEDEDEEYFEDDEEFFEDDIEDDSLDTEDDPDGPIPDKFVFESRIIFISNLTAVPQPLLDRCITIGMNLTNKEITDLIEDRLESLASDLPNVTMDDKVAVLKFMRKYVGRNTKVYTFRLFAQLCALYTSDNPNKEKMMYITLMTGMKTTMR